MKQIFSATRDFAADRIALSMGRRHSTGEVSVVTRLNYEHLPAGSILSAPPLTLTHADAQALMDELWNIGVRPADINRQPAVANTWLQDQLVKFINQATKDPS